MRRKILVSTLISFFLFSASFLSIINIYVAEASQPPVDQNVLNIGGVGMPSRADPATAYDTSSGSLIMSVYETLISFARNTSEPDPRKQGLVGEFEPKLAKDLPTKEVITLNLHNVSLVGSDPTDSYWEDVITYRRYHIIGWRDNRPDDMFGARDVVYFEEVNLGNEPIDCTRFTYQVQSREEEGNEISITVKRNWYIFELRQGVRIHPWKYYNGTLAPPANLTTEDVEYSFERALVQDRLYGPTWMLYKPMLDAINTDDGWNVSDINDLTELAHLIDCAIQRNSTHIKINVGTDFPQKAWYQILSQTWGSIVPKAFAIDHGCWPGTFFNATGYPHWIYWRRWPIYHRSPLDRAPTTKTPLPGAPAFNWAGHAEPAPILRGTGPYKFTYWSTEMPTEWRIDKFDNYWGGWTGNHVNSVIMTAVPDWTTRKTKFLNGDFDVISVPRAYISQLLESTPPYNPLPGIVCYKDIQTLSADSMHFQYNVTTGSDYMPSIGGVNQSDFFGNIYARKAFAYALNFTKLLKDVWFNAAEQPATWHIKGLVPDYRDPSVEKYDIDLDKIEYHLQNAFFENTSLWDSGFNITLVHNEESDQRRIACEMIKETIEILNENRTGLPFVIDIVALSWSDFLSEMEIGNLPCWEIGWLADFADADNWVRPYMHSEGDLAFIQKYSNTTVDIEINLAVKTPDGPDRRDLYYDLQRTFINECPTLMTAQPYTRYWCRNWVQGWYYNPLATFIPCSDFYAIWKSEWKSEPSTRYAWPMFHQNLGHTGYAEGPAPTTNQTQWNYTTGGTVESSPAVADGKVYVGSWDGKVYCLDAITGAHIWNHTTSSAVSSSPAVADGKVYVGSEDWQVYCLNALTGAKIWNYTTGNIVRSSPSVADGKVYVGSQDGKVYCLNALTGALIWNYTTGAVDFSSPAVADGKVYVGSHDGKVYCLDAITGAHIWNHTTGTPLESSPSVADGKAYVGSADKNVYCLNALTGAVIWNYTTGGWVLSSPAVADGKVYVGSWDCKVYCLNALTGALIWNYTTSSAVSSSPAVADGKVYVGSADNRVYCLNALTGAHIWNYTTGDYVVSSPAVADGMVFIGSNDCKIYAFGNVIRVPEQISTVAEAIEVADSGAIISIASGIYLESVVINKPLTILGRRGSSPNFVGGGSGIAITILSNASGTIIAGIVITNYAQGILVSDSSNCTIYDNIMTLNVNSGVALEGSNAVNNTIYNNIFQNNPGAAINLTEYSTSNTIYNNTIYANNIGIYLEYGGNTIYWNIFVDNTIQVQIATSLYNTWDNGYPDGGNYWSNHPCVDLFKGPLQNELGSDGINDTRCTIAVNNIDWYPLVKPFSPHDIGIATITTSKTIIGQGLILRIDLKILNYGIHNEFFTITVYANTTIMATQAITLTKRNSTVIKFYWNTTGVAKGNYIITGYVTLVQDEADAADNTSPGGTVKVGVRGDLNGDNKCNILDLVKEAGKFGAEKGDPNSPPAPKYDPNYDFNDDDKINILDLVKVAGYFGTMDP